MKILITGSLGLIGSEIAEYYLKNNFEVLGIDNDQRKEFFGKAASNYKNLEILKKYNNYSHFDFDIRDKDLVETIFSKNKDIEMIVHSAAQPSHDWARDNKFIDFSINALSSLILLEATYNILNNCSFVYFSTNKVYGDNPNKLNLIEINKRFDLMQNDKFFNGIDTTMSIDQNLHSFFGVSKLTADLLVQEYGKTYQMNTICLRGGCLTGGRHSGAKAHGFLSYLVKSIVNDEIYTVEGYKGLQVRDNIHAFDVATLVEQFRLDPVSSGVFNIGGGRDNSVSILEAVSKIEKILNTKAKINIIDKNRLGDHKWYITDNSHLMDRYPNWKITKDLNSIIEDILKS